MDTQGEQSPRPEPAPVQPTPTEEIKGVVGETKKAADRLAERSENEGDVKMSLDADAKQDLEDILGKAAPDLEQEKRKALLSSLSAEPGLEPKALTTLASQFKDAGFNKYQAEKALSTTKFSDEEKQQILDQFPDMTEEEKAKTKSEDENIPDKEADEMKEKAKAMKEQLEEADREIDASDLPDEKKEELKKKIGNAYRRVTDFFGEEEPGRIWARRIGKTLYFSAITLFLLVVFEMNLINKMAKKPGGR